MTLVDSNILDATVLVLWNIIYQFSTWPY